MRNVGLKKLYVGLIALALVAVIPAMPAKAAVIDGLEFEVCDDEDCTIKYDHIKITGYTGTAEEVTIPKLIDGRPVAEIGADAFNDNVVITKVELPEGIVVIGGYAFADCNNLATINFPSTVETIEVYAFRNCSSLSEVMLPNKLKKIGNGAFYYCKKIEEIEFHAGLETIGQNAFNNTKLSQVSIPDSVTYIRAEAFKNTPWLESQKNGKKNVVVKNHLLWCECPNNGKVVVPEGVTYIPESFFVRSLVSTIVLPNSLKEIEKFAFNYCYNLSSIVIPSEVTSIGEAVFAGDASLNFIFYPKNVDKYVSASQLSTNTTKFLYSIADNKAVIHRIKNLGDKTEITVPSEISGYTVAFSDEVKESLGGITINHTHTGGNATCTQLAVCSICDEEYGEFAHEYSNEWTTDGTNHWHECTVCGHKKDISAHTGGNATCTQLAVCSICDEEYGEFAHEYSAEWTTDGTNHWHECTACGDKKDISAHTLKTTTTKATLTTDGKIETKCSVCNKTKTTPIYAASNISLLKDTAAYTGKTQKPKAVVKDSKGNAINASYYTLSLPTGLKKVGSYKVKVTLKGDLYEGSKTLTFKINPAKTKLSSVKAGSKSMTLKWAGKTTEVTGYEIRYSLKKDLKGAKSVIVKSAKSTSKEIKKLKAKKTYYVQIRTYKTVKGKKYYSDWSAAKKVKIKN